MGASRRPGVLGLAFPGSFPASRPPGTLGLLDQRDPGVRLTSPPAAKSSPAPAAGSELDLESAQQMALEITTFFESGKSMNYQALAGDFDGQGISFGLVQWNFGQNTLGPLLKKMLARDAQAFAGCFGKDADYETLRAALARDDQAAQLAWARAIQRVHRHAWVAAFKALGTIAAFNRIQRGEASAKYHPLVAQCIAHLRKLRSDLMQAVEFRSYAALFDLCVQQGGLDKALHSIKSTVGHEKPTTQLALLTIAVVERGRISKKWAADCISRRMGILTAGAYEATEHGQVVKRANPYLELIGKHGGTAVAGL